jgi:hypothetical protein
MAFAKQPSTSSVLMIQIVLLLGVVVVATLASSEGIQTGMDGNDYNPSGKRRGPNKRRRLKSGKVGKTKSSKTTEVPISLPSVNLPYSGGIFGRTYYDSVDCGETRLVGIDPPYQGALGPTIKSISVLEPGTFCIGMLLGFSKYQTDSCELQNPAKSSKSNKSSSEQVDESLLVTYSVHDDCDSVCGSCSGNQFVQIDKFPNGFDSTSSCLETEIAGRTSSIDFQQSANSVANAEIYWEIINDYSCIQDYPNYLPEGPTTPPSF